MVFNEGDAYCCSKLNIKYANQYCGISRKYSGGVSIAKFSAEKNTVYSKGELIGNISSSNKLEYPTNGSSNGYYYVYTGMQ